METHRQGRGVSGRSGAHATLMPRRLPTASCLSAIKNMQEQIGRNR